MGEETLAIVSEWVTYLREEKLWGNDHPLFPATHIGLGKNRQFEALGLSRNDWSNATPIRKIFREAFNHVGLPYFNPHSFRNTLVQLGQDICMTPEQFKAWSQNLRHEKVLTTFLSYGEVSNQRQGDIIRSLGIPQNVRQPDANGLADVIVRKLTEAGIESVLRQKNVANLDNRIAKFGHGTLPKQVFSIDRSQLIYGKHRRQATTRLRSIADA